MKQIPTDHRITTMTHNRTLSGYSDAGTTNKNSKFELYRRTNGAEPVANSWDAMHLDTFLNTSIFAQTPGKYRHYSTDKKHKVKVDSFTKQLPRFDHDREFKYLQNITNDFLGEQHNLNPIVLNSSFNEKLINRHLEKNLATPQKNFQASKIDILTQPDALLTSKNRLNLMKEVKKQQDEFHGWKEKYRAILRHDKLIKTRYQGGVIGVDTPENPNSHYYKQKYETLKTEEQAKEHSRERRIENLKHIHGTSPAIKFLNQSYDPCLDENEYPAMHRSTVKTVKAPFMGKYQDSKNRMFPEAKDEFKMSRRAFALNKKNNVRGYNILTGHVTVLDTLESPRKEVNITVM